MTGPVEVLPVDHAAVRDYMTERARLALNGTTGPHADLLLRSFARHRLAERARMSTAAPDLLKAAERALNFIANTECEMGETLESGDLLRAAIAKAKGQ